MQVKIIGVGITNNYNMQDFFTVISNFGFPVAVASYLLFRFEKKLETLEKINYKLVEKAKSLELEVKKLENIIKKKGV